MTPGGLPAKWLGVLFAVAFVALALYGVSWGAYGLAKSSDVWVNGVHARVEPKHWQEALFGFRLF